MKKTLLILGLILMFTIAIMAQTNHKETTQLTDKQKLDDFEYLYEILKDNYPYFGVLQREHNIKWLDYKVLQYGNFVYKDGGYKVTVK